MRLCRQQTAKETNVSVKNIRKHGVLMSLVVFLFVDSVIASTTTPNDLLASYAQEMKAKNPNFQGFSAKRGEVFYKENHGQEWSCASCHTDNPANVGSHAITKKVIQPLAPSVNAERFTDPAKVDKWFKRNCNDVLKRECTTQEKGDFITYLLTVKK